MVNRSPETLTTSDLEKAQGKAPEDSQAIEQELVSPPTTKEDPEKTSYLVSLGPEDDPKYLSTFRKCLIVLIVSTGALCSTSSTSMAAFAEAGIVRDFHVSKEVAILGVSLSVAGIGFGPLFAGPLSEVFMTGFFSSAFLSVAGGSVSDLFDNHKVGVPVALYALSPFIGPMLGPLVSGFINQLVPETYEPVLRQRKAKKLRQATGDDRYYAPLDERQVSMSRAILTSCYMPFKLLALDRMNLLLDLWTAILFGILYLAFQAWPFIFGINHGFDVQTTGLAFIGIGIGMVIGCALNVALTIRNQRKFKGVDAPAEERLTTGKIGAVVVPLSLYWLAFTTYRNVHWIAPIIASVGFGAGFLLCFTSTFTYLVTAYRPMAATSMAGNAFVRSAFAAAFPLFAGQMYEKLGTVGATALLAGVMTIAAPLPKSLVIHASVKLNQVVDIDKIEGKVASKQQIEKAVRTESTHWSWKL
ncbi:hypothetical protein PHLCEN_2v10528 [Hermanssonia centrifuga]|uniref:MFS general substrate transporter n=1 Tax=Hermanssonia centrifuga TaxID=98765 RepID=A0A2R6NMJ4_9APHY|nr:hypothetical protein PHLCEN_2v10528 [Hermanssonia centrifuga]